MFARVRSRDRDDAPRPADVQVEPDAARRLDGASCARATAPRARSRSWRTLLPTGIAETGEWKTSIPSFASSGGEQALAPEVAGLVRREVELPEVRRQRERQLDRLARDQQVLVLAVDLDQLAQDRALRPLDARDRHGVSWIERSRAIFMGGGV